jgi:hypothetical protein
MSSTDERRTFTVRFDDGTEKHRLTAQSPYVAAMKAARRLIDPDGITDPELAKENNERRIYFREIGTRTLYVYDAWTWVKDDACPACLSHRTYMRKTKWFQYRCAACGEEFDEPLVASELDIESDMPEHLANAEQIVEAEGESRGRSKVPESELSL